MREVHDMNHFHMNHTVLLDDIKKKLWNLGTRKVTQISDMPTKIFKGNIDIPSPFLINSVNCSIRQSNFPHNLKFAEATPVYNKESTKDKTHYRAVSILPNLSKVFENIFYKQLSGFFENIFLKYQTGFRKPSSKIV